MTTPYARAQAYQRIAADPSYSVFVTANAGSGKTKVLVDRIARLLLAGATPSAFLCITFTKAAAAEMQRRLFDRLGKWCVASDEALRRDLAALGEEAPDGVRLAQARALFARALETPGGLRIQTIHAFCERLLARFPLEAGVPPGFSTVDGPAASDIAADAWSRALAGGDDDLEAAVDRLAARFDGATFEELRTEMMNARNRIERFVSAHQEVASAARAIWRRHDAEASAEDLRARALAGARWTDLTAAIPVLESSKPKDSKKNTESKDGKSASRMRAALADRSFESYCAIFFNKDGEPHGDTPTKSLLAREPAIASLFDAERARLGEAVSAIAAAESAEDSAAALHIAYALRKAYEAAKANAGALDFDDLIQRALQLLESSSSAQWVLYKLDAGIEHILVDEGQDTSPDQWRLLRPLQDEFFAGDARAAGERTVFAVGDPKQSIYSFQGADPERFLAEAQALQARAGEGRFVAPEMTMSFRSAPEVLRAVDAVFEGQPILAGAPGDADIVRHAARREAEGGLVEVWPLAPRPVAEAPRPWDAPLDVERQTTSAATLAHTLAVTVREWIEEGQGVWENGARRAMRPGDVLALVRSRGPLFRHLIKALKRVGLPVAGADRIVLSDEIAVQDMLTLARVALDPGDDLALATLLKSPLIGLTDDDGDIFPLAAGRAQGERLWSRLQAADARYDPARALVSEAIALRGAHPHVFLTSFLERLDETGVSGWERMFARLGAEARDPLEELLSRALTHGRERSADLQSFVHAIENDAAEIKREAEQGGDVVRVMTVHGAKGLEAPVVLLADTTGAAGSGKDPLLFAEDDGPILRGAGAALDAVTVAARERLDGAAQREHLRLLYVAMTRARDRLIVCGHARGNGTVGFAGGAWWPLVQAGLARAGAEACATPFGEGLRIGSPFVAAAVTTERQDIAPPEWARRRAPSAGPETSSAPSAAQPEEDAPALSPRRADHGRFRRGLMIHGLLERLPEIDPQDREAAAMRWLDRQGVRDGEAASFAGEAIRVIEDPRFAAVFGPGSRAEAPLIATLPDGAMIRGVVDRLAVGSGEVLVLDYKTDRPPPVAADATPPRILRQMAQYRAALRLIFPGRLVRTAVLWTEAPRLVELPDALLDRHISPASASPR